MKLVVFSGTLRSTICCYHTWPRSLKVVILVMISFSSRKGWCFSTLRLACQKVAGHVFSWPEGWKRWSNPMVCKKHWCNTPWFLFRNIRKRHWWPHHNICNEPKRMHSRERGSSILSLFNIIPLCLNFNVFIFFYL